MSTVDLTLLGALMEKPLNAYEMKKIIESRNIERWIKISTPSVYKNLVKLYKKGYLDGEVVKEGEMPEKTIYTINEKGREYFLELMSKYSTDPGNVYVDFSAFVANLHNVDKETGLKMVEDMQEKFRTKIHYLDMALEQKINLPSHARSLIEVYHQMFTLFLNWSEDMKNKYKHS